MAVRLRWPGRLLAASRFWRSPSESAEGLAVAFEVFLQNRVVDIMRAAGEVDRAVGIAAIKSPSGVASLVGEVKDLDAQVAALARSMPSPPASSNRTCTLERPAGDLLGRRRSRRRLPRRDEGLRRAPWGASRTSEARCRPE